MISIDLLVIAGNGEAKYAIRVTVLLLFRMLTITVQEPRFFLQ